MNQQKAPRPITDEECKCKNFTVIKIKRIFLAIQVASGKIGNSKLKTGRLLF
jgi:hypothetical protein